MIHATFKCDRCKKTVIMKTGPVLIEPPFSLENNSTFNELKNKYPNAKISYDGFNSYRNKKTKEFECFYDYKILENDTLLYDSKTEKKNQFYHIKEGRILNSFYKYSKPIKCSCGGRLLGIEMHLGDE